MMPALLQLQASCRTATRRLHVVRKPRDNDPPQTFFFRQGTDDWQSQIEGKERSHFRIFENEAEFFACIQGIDINDNSSHRQTCKVSNYKLRTVRQLNAYAFSFFYADS